MLLAESAAPLKVPPTLRLESLVESVTADDVPALPSRRLRVPNCVLVEILVNEVAIESQKIAI